MSVLMQFAMFPTDKGESVSFDVSKILDMIDKSGVTYKLGAMGTTIETETMDEALEIINKSYNLLSDSSERIYATVSFDIRKKQTNRINKKIESVESKIGKINK